MYDEDMGGAGSIKELAAALACLPVAPVAGDIEELLALRDRLDAKLSEALRVFDAEQLLGRGRLAVADGVAGCTWQAVPERCAPRGAHRQAAFAAPHTAAAWAEGVLSSSQVGAVVANVSAEHASLYAAHEDELTPVLAALSVRDTAAAMRSWRLHAEATTDGAEPPRVPRSSISPRPWRADESSPGTCRSKMTPWSKRLSQLLCATSTRPSRPCRARRSAVPLRSSMSAGGSWTTPPRPLRVAARGRMCLWWSA